MCSVLILSDSASQFLCESNEEGELARLLSEPLSTCAISMRRKVLGENSQDVVHYEPWGLVMCPPLQIENIPPLEQ